MPTLATLLKAQGFATAAFVGAFPLDARFGLTPGFDVYDGRFDDLSGGGFIIAERPATRVVDAANAWIRAQSGRWFTWVHVYEPHAPYRPPPPFDKEYANRPYFGEVAAVDAALGSLFDLVRASPRPTLAILTGDHGEALGDHGETTHGLFAYESTLRVPLIITELAPHGSDRRATLSESRRPEISDAPARHVDILPTVLDALQIAAPPDLPGHSLRRSIDRSGAAERASYFEAMSPMLDYGWAPLTGVLSGREKYIDLPLTELYDLAADPGEHTNLSVRAPERQRALSARLAAFNASLPAASGSTDPEVARRLQSLGYVSGGAAPKTHFTEADDPKRLVEVDQWMHDAVARDDDGHTREAIEVYRWVLAKRPDMMAASRHVAFDYWRTGDAASAIAALRAALRAGPTPGAQVQLGTYLTETGHAGDALALLQQAAAADPNLDALNALGIAYARSGKSAEALATFARSLQIDPDNAMTHENIGAISLDAGRLAEARGEFEHALRANPMSAQGHAGLAMVAIRQGDRASAIASWKRAVTLDPTNFDALYDLGIQLVKGGQLADARPYLEQFVRTAPSSLYAKDIRDVSALLAKMR
jgi:tetratricopeptide (TPR) repeat protein